MRGLALVVLLALAAGGCSSWWTPKWPPSTWMPAPRPAAKLLADADRSVSEGKYQDALEAYDEILAKYPDAEEAPRASARREPLADLIAARAQISRLATAVRNQENDLARLRSELARSRQEIQRLTEESEKLRADLEQLKRIDIDLERRRKQ